MELLGTSAVNLHRDVILTPSLGETVTKKTRTEIEKLHEHDVKAAVKIANKFIDEKSVLIVCTAVRF